MVCVENWEIWVYTIWCLVIGFIMAYGIFGVEDKEEK